MDFEILGDEFFPNYEKSVFFSYVENKNVNYSCNSNKVNLNDQISIVVINELLRRYCFVYDNAEIILGQLIYEAVSRNMSFGKRLANNTNIYINEKNCPLEGYYDLLRLFEEFMIGDIQYEETAFYKLICAIRDDKSLFKITKKSFVNEDVRDYNMRVALECISFMIEQQKGAYINIRISDKEYERVYDEVGFVRTITISDIRQKLKSLKPYFDILFYQNKENGRWNGERRIWVDRRDEFDVDFSLVDHNSFNKNFYDYCLPERALQTIYCRHHDELPWNMQVNCVGDDSFERPNNTSCCGEIFRVKEENMFNIGNDIYHLCPNCGYMVRINDVKESIRRRIIKRCSEDENYLRKRVLMSEFVALDRFSKAKILVK